MKPVPFNISNDLLNIIIGIATLLISLTAFGIELEKYKYLKFAKSLWFRAPTLITFSVIIICATIIKDKDNEVRNSNDLFIRDSINQKRFNKSLEKVVASASKTEVEVMAKYYLKYDSVQHTIERIVKDSAKKTASTSEIVPELNISNTEGTLSNDTLLLATTVAASQAAVYNLKYVYNYICRKNLSNYSDKSLQMFEGKSETGKNKITIDEPKEIQRKFYNPEFKLMPFKVYIYFKGTYESQRGKVFNFEILTYYNVVDKKNGYLTDAEYKWIHNYILKYNKN